MTPTPDRAALLRDAQAFLDNDFDDYTATDAGTHWMPALMDALREEMAARKAERADRDLLPADHVLVPDAVVRSWGPKDWYAELVVRFEGVCAYVHEPHPTRAEAEACGGRALMRLRRGEEPWE